MSYTPGLGREMSELFKVSAECEELDLPHKEFVAKYARMFKIVCTITAIASICAGLPLFFLVNKATGLIFLVLGICMFLLLPTILFYRCKINKDFLQEEYWVLCFKFTKKISWNNIKYKKIKIGNNNSIKFYDGNKKRLISFDDSTVGFNRIIKMSKRSTIREIE